jgi:lipid A ethanolaminephosphotransferase
MFTLKNNIKLIHFALLMSLVNFLFFHYPFYKFVINNLDFKSWNGAAIVVSLVILMIVANAYFFYIIFFLSRIVGKVLLIVFFTINAIALYFINTYNIIVDESMIGNVLNTKYEESSSFFSFKLVLYIIIFAVLPSIYIIKAKIINATLKQFFITISATLVFMGLMAFANASNWLWIDKNSKTLGGLAMPWNYVVNISLFYKHKAKENEKEILLPNATIKDDKKAVMVLVIGESARSQNFSLYGYNKNTNPLLSTVTNLTAFKANACATYTTAGVKCILEHKNTDDLYEILPNYLERNNVEVIWRTNNWGEPPVHVKNYQPAATLMPNCKAEDCDYDGILLHGLKEQILASKKNKILIVLHLSTSHGPTYNKKYPPQFEVFKPVCNSVELGNCSQESLINAYDNTIVYTDYILFNLVENLKQLTDYSSSMIFVSDHGESLGEKNLYMHGMPLSLAPKEQFEIPFLVWRSDTTKQLKANNTLTQGHVFHSVLNALSIQSEVYNEDLNIFK